MMGKITRVLIVDDERASRRRLAKLLAGMADVEVIGEAENGIVAVEMIEREKPDVVLLDVQMPGLDGFEVVRELRGADVPLIIFVTAYDQYALKAFELSAVDYLLKPVAVERLEKALAKARQLNTKPATADLALEQIHSLAAALGKGRPAYLQRVVGRRSNKLQIIPADTIQAFVTDRELVFAINAEGRLLVNHTLKELEATLDPEHFVRVHKGTIVNLAQVVEIEPMFKGGAVARLQSGSRVEISRRYAVALRKKMRW